MTQLVQLQRDKTCEAFSPLLLEKCEERSHLAKLTQQQVTEIRSRYAAGGTSQEALAAEYNVRQGTVSRIIHGVRWTPQQGDL